VARVRHRIREGPGPPALSVSSDFPRPRLPDNHRHRLLYRHRHHQRPASSPWKQL